MTSDTKKTYHSNGHTDTEESKSQDQQRLKPDHQLEYKEVQHTDENLITLQKIHAILLNCINLSKKQKLEFAESERYFMKLYLKKFQDKNRE